MERALALLTAMRACDRPVWWGTVTRDTVVSLLHLGRTDTAVGWAARVAEANPDVGGAWLELAIGLHARGEALQAAAAARRGMAAANPDTYLSGAPGALARLRREAALAEAAIQAVRQWSEGVAAHTGGSSLPPIDRGSDSRRDPRPTRDHRVRAPFRLRHPASSPATKRRWRRAARMA